MIQNVLSAVRHILPTALPTSLEVRLSYRRMLLFVGALCVFRLVYGLTTEFWFADQDVLQIYLIGLKYFTTGNYPYFGADLVYTQTQIPGALQAFLVSFGWFVFPFAETPHITLGLMNCCACGVLAWYITKRLPMLPVWFVWGWIFLLPWTLAYCTRVINPSYVLPGATVFFLCVYELLPATRQDILPRWWAYYGLGFGVLWIFQLHMSWVLLLPCIAVATLLDFYQTYQLYRNTQTATQALQSILPRLLLYGSGFLAGAATTGATLLPTLLHYGLSGKSGSAGITSVVTLNIDHVKELVSLLVKFFAYCCFDTTRFFGGSTAERSDFLMQYWWATPATIIVTLVGAISVVGCILCFFWKNNPAQGWKTIRVFTIFLFVMMYMSSWFSLKLPGGHATVLYIVPTIFYAAHCLAPFADRQWFRRLALTTLCSAGIMYCAIAWKNYTTISLYTNRVTVQKAIDTKNYKLVGERRYEQGYTPSR